MLWEKALQLLITRLCLVKSCHVIAAINHFNRLRGLWCVMVTVLETLEKEHDGFQIVYLSSEKNSIVLFTLRGSNGFLFVFLLFFCFSLFVF